MSAPNYEAFYRARKVHALTRAIDREAFNLGLRPNEVASRLQRFGDSEWFALARFLKINPPSRETVRDVIAQYGEATP